MLDKEKICAAFCDEVAVSKVPAGYAVKTAFHTADGDPVGFYVVPHQDDPTRWRFEDSGVMVPMLESHGITLKGGAREEAFNDLLSEYGADFDEDAQEIVSRWINENEVGSAALGFVALLLRLQDLEFLAPDKVESAFREDAAKAIANRFSGVAQVKFNTGVSEKLPNYIVDAVISIDNAPPVAVFYATSEPRVSEAVILWMDSKISKVDLKVILLLEHAKPRNVSERMFARALNHLDACPAFRGFEMNAMDKIASYVPGTETRQ
jgi:hypothetical protein